MKKRIISVILCVTMLCGVLSGCGNSTDSEIDTQMSTEANSELNTQESTTENMENVEQTEAEETLYTITEDEIVNRELKEFFQLWLGCKINPHCDVEVKNLSTMLEHGNIVGNFIYDDGLRIIDDYNDKCFEGLGAYVYFAPAINQNDTTRTYRVSVNGDFANFDTFNYYAGTDAVLSLVVRVSCYVNDIEVEDIVSGYKGSYVFAVTLVNETNNPEEWLLTGVYDLNFSGEEFTKESASTPKLAIWGDYYSLAKENGFDLDTSLVDEDVQKNMESMEGTRIGDILNAYKQELSRLNSPKTVLIQIGDSETPYMIAYDSNKVCGYYYKNGSANCVELATGNSQYIELTENYQLSVQTWTDRGENYSVCEYKVFDMKDGNFVLLDSLREKKTVDSENVDLKEYTYFDASGNLMENGAKNWFKKYQVRDLTIIGDEDDDVYNESLEEAYTDMIIWE